MYPVIFSFGPVTIYSFGLLLFIGFIVGLFAVWKRGKEENYDEEKIYDVILISSIFSLIGARIVYILTHFDLFGLNILPWVNLIGQPGFSLFGAFIGGAIGLIIKTKKEKWDFFAFADITVVGITIFLVFGWLGAFLNGTGVGEPTTSALGLTFSGLYDKRHPTQIYALILYLALSMFLWRVEGKYRTFEWYRAGKSSAQSGFLLFSFLIFSGLIGFLLSFLMPSSVFLLNIRIETWLWASVSLVGLFGLYLRSGRLITQDISHLKGFIKIKKNKQKVRKRLRKSPLNINNKLKDIIEN